MIWTQMLYLLARAAGLALVLLLTPVYTIALKGMRSSYLEA